VDTNQVLQAEGATNQLAVILINQEDGERTVIWDWDPKLLLKPEEVEREGITQAKILHLDGHHLEASILAARWAREAGVLVSLDAETVSPQTRQLVPLTQVLISDETFPRKYTGKKNLISALEIIQSQGPLLVGATLGKEGAVIMSDYQLISSPGFPVKTVDTTGAGDVFHGAFLFGLLKGWELRQTLDFANAAAAMNCRVLGGRKGIPTLAEALNFISRFTPEGHE
jgi:sugar/nucleoside kinase (ribokinase family)